MADQGTAVARRDTSDVGHLQQQLQSRAREIQMALPAHITPDKFQRTILTAVAQNPDLLKADRNSLILSVYKAAQDGLLPDGREAALVTFNTRRKSEGGQWETVKQVQYMPMVYGLRKKILQSGDVVALEVAVVYKIEAENGYFRYEVGTEPPLNYAPMLDIPDDEATDEKMIVAFSVATMKDGTKSYEVMRRSEINKVRQVSQTGATGKTDRQGKAIPPKGPWVDWQGEMWKKTVMRRHAKTLPMSGDVLIDVEGRELERGVSTALALGSMEPDAPELLTDDSGTSYDGETGEVHDEEEQQGNATAGEATESSTQQPKADQGSGPTSTTAKEHGGASQSEDDDDQGGQTDAEPDHMVPVAEEIINAFGGAANVPNLKKIYDDAQLDIAGMSDELAKTVGDAYDRNLRRMGTSRAKLAAAMSRTRETEPAK